MLFLRVVIVKLTQLFGPHRRVYEWSECSEGEVKVGLDHIMCSMCHVRPQLFTQLLLNMSVLAAIDNNQSITDDRWEALSGVVWLLHSVLKPKQTLQNDLSFQTRKRKLLPK